MTSQVALYARVSSEKQADTKTIASQIAVLRERIQSDGETLADEMQFVDDGFSGTTLIRPGLERLRDHIASGLVDKIYVLSPDRLARKYAYQVLLIDEFKHSGVELIFINHEVGRTPEGELLLQMQGMIAEYERAKILERCRRGRLHTAQRGSVNVLTCAPYGYRYISKSNNVGEAVFEINEAEADNVKKIFNWFVREKKTLREVVHELKKIGQVTRFGNANWGRRTIAQILNNTAYKGMAAFGKTRCGPIRPRLRPVRCKNGQSKQTYSAYDVPEDEWIYIPVPPIIDAAVFDAAQEQLQENKKRARKRHTGAKYLLQSLVVCSHCRYAFHGIHRKATPRKNGSMSAEYTYYRCSGSDKSRYAGEAVCSNKQIKGDLLEAAVWDEVKKLLGNPNTILMEHQRRLAEISDLTEDKGCFLEQQISKMKQGISRLIDAYAEGHIEKQDFELRIKSIKQRLLSAEEQVEKQKDRYLMEAELKLIIGKIEEFSKLITTGLDKADWSVKRNIICALVKRIEAGKDLINVVFRVGDTLPNPNSNPIDFLQHCARGSSPEPAIFPDIY
jgi:site-specific DNA recombinase